MAAAWRIPPFFIRVLGIGPPQQVARALPAIPQPVQGAPAGALPHPVATPLQVAAQQRHGPPGSLAPARLGILAQQPRQQRLATGVELGLPPAVVPFAARSSTAW